MNKHPSCKVTKPGSNHSIASNKPGGKSSNKHPSGKSGHAGSGSNHRVAGSQR